MEILIGLVALIPPTAAGFLWVSAFDRRQTLRRVERLALGYGIGGGLLAWEMLLFHLAGWRFSTLKLWIPLLAASAALYAILKREATSATAWPGKSGPSTILDRCLFAAILLQVALVFGKAWLQPMEAYDAVANWGLKAKAIFLAQAIPVDFLQNPEYQTFHPDYPLLVPLLESSVYQFTGSVSEPGAKSIFALFLASCLVLFFHCLKRAGLNRPTALAFTFLLVSIPYFNQHATNGYADIVITFYFGIGTLYLYLWRSTGSFLFLAIAALLMSFAALTKNEGLVLAVIPFIALVANLAAKRESILFLKKRVMSLALYFLTLMVIVLPWYWLKTSLGLRNDVVNAATLSDGLAWKNLERLGPMLYHLQTQIFGPKNWNLVWLLFLATLLLRWRALRTEPARLVLITIGVTLFCYSLVYLVTPYMVWPYDVAWHLRTSASRLLLHVLPQVVFLTALASQQGEGSRPRPAASNVGQLGAMGTSLPT